MEKILIGLIFCAVVLFMASPWKEREAVAAGGVRGAAEQGSWSSILGAKLVNHYGFSMGTETLKGSRLGLYFSASWCGPCQSFTPELISFYKANQSRGFEVVLVPGDRSDPEMIQYMKQHAMPWLALPLESKRVQSLFQKYGVRGIPALVILDPAGRVVSRDGRTEMMRYGRDAFTRWN